MANNNKHCQCWRVVQQQQQFVNNFSLSNCQQCVGRLACPSIVVRDRMKSFVVNNLKQHTLLSSSPTTVSLFICFIYLFIFVVVELLLFIIQIYICCGVVIFVESFPRLSYIFFFFFTMKKSCETNFSNQESGNKFQAKKKWNKNKNRFKKKSKKWMCRKIGMHIHC